MATDPQVLFSIESAQADADRLKRAALRDVLGTLIIVAVGTWLSGLLKLHPYLTVGLTSLIAMAGGVIAHINWNESKSCLEEKRLLEIYIKNPIKEPEENEAHPKL